MRAVTVREISQELTYRTPKELRDLCLRLARFKKENKELLTYLLFESSDEQLYIESVKREIDEQFEHINRKSYYLMKKSVRKILSTTRKYIRYSLKKQTEVELLIYFCSKLKALSPSIKKSPGLLSLYNRLIDGIIVKVSLLHEDLRHDYGLELNELSL
ncbi:MAG: hypothetical protein MUC70_05835 [Bacteroidales bacterium]|nr:hypothetical protein [Bacteroidales bacterium]